MRISKDMHMDAVTEKSYRLCLLDEEINDAIFRSRLLSHVSYVDTTDNRAHNTEVIASPKITSSSGLV